VKLIGELGDQSPEIWSECLFVDPIADIAVLGAPDAHSLSEESDAYEIFLADRTPITARPARDNERCWLLSLNLQWNRCEGKHVGGPLWITKASAGLQGGMSGSPIITEDGHAIGVFVTSGGVGDDPDFDTEGGPQPRLDRNLPAWLWAVLAAERS
jgi:hypothetical protein